LAERDELLADHVPAGLLDVSLDRAMRLPRPHIVAADQVPALCLLDVGEPMNRRPALPARRLADRDDARRPLTALIDGWVDIGDATACGHLAEREAARAGVQTDDEIDLVEGDRLFGTRHDLVHRAACVVDRELDLAPQDSAALVDLGDRKLRAVGG